MKLIASLSGLSSVLASKFIFLRMKTESEQKNRSWKLLHALEMVIGLTMLLPLTTWAGETGYKDSVIAYPGQVTRIKAKFDLPGQYVWHCHIVEHEDNEMMRPYRIGPMP